MHSSRRLEHQISLFIGGIFPNVTYQELKGSLNRIAPIKSLKIIRNKESGLCKGYAFLTVSDRWTCQKLLQTKIRLRDRFLTCQERGLSQSKIIRKSKRVFVGGLINSITDIILHSQFEEKFGKVRAAYVIRAYSSRRSKGYGYVEFESQEDARYAIDCRSTQIGCFTVDIQEYKGQHGTSKKKISKIKSKNVQWSNTLYPQNHKGIFSLPRIQRRRLSTKNNVPQPIEKSILSKIINKCQELDSHPSNLKFLRRSHEDLSSHDINQYTIEG